MVAYDSAPRTISLAGPAIEWRAGMLGLHRRRPGGSGQHVETFWVRADAILAVRHRYDRDDGAEVLVNGDVWQMVRDSVETIVAALEGAAKVKEG
jgi:hypothetical protein